MTREQFPESLKADLAVTYAEGRQARANAEWRQLCEIVPTTSSAKREAFYGGKGHLRRFRGERQPNTFYEYHQNITLDDWEMTETVKRQVLDDDQSGGFLKNKIGNFALAVDIELQRRTEEHLRRGTSYRCFDTNMFFSRNHVYTDSRGNTLGTLWTNLNTGGSQVDATTVQLMQNHFAKLMDDRDRVLGMKLTHLGVRRGTLNAKAAKELANSQYTIEVATVRGANTNNIFQGAFGIIEFDYGIGDSEWYAFDLSDKSMLPIKILSHSISPGFDNMQYTQLLEESDSGFWRNEFAFGVFGRFDWNPGDPRSAVFNGTTTWVDPEDDDWERRRELEANAV